MNTKRMTKKQLHRSKSLIKKLCCNCDNGYCIALDCKCPQMHSYSVLCHWFRDAVLPQNNDLNLQLIKSYDTKHCVICRIRFIPTCNRALYCDNCRKLVRRRKDTERKRNKRHMSAFKSE